MTDENPTDRWKPWKWSSTTWWLLLLVFTMVLPFGVRAWFLSHVPDVGESFEVRGFYPTDLPPEQNAFTHYKAAIRKFELARRDWYKSSRMQSLKDPMFAHAYAEGLSVLTENELEWLADQRDALDEWRLGTEMSQAQALALVGMGPATLLPVHGESRQLIALARIEALRCEANGDTQAAWEWHRAICRFCRHLNAFGGIMQRQFGTYSHVMSADGIAAWAGNPLVTVEQLREALSHVRSEYALNAPLSDALKVDYLFFLQGFRSSSWTKTGQGIFDNRPQWEERVAFLRRPALWAIGEPDLFLRLNSQILLNQLGEIDQPLAQRQSVVGKQLYLFNPDPAVELKPRQLCPAAIESAHHVSVLRHLIGTFASVKHLDDMVWNERARQAALEVTLAAQMYRRDKGEFPESLDQLVPEYLETVPLDPCDLNGGRLRYRRNDPNKAIVWSIGRDGNDDGGEVVVQNGVSADVGFVLKGGELK